MSTSIAISTMAATQSAAANAAAREAKEKACVVLVQSYEAKGATVEEMRSYAECVNTLHPDDLSPGAVSALKVCVLVCFGFAAFFWWRERKSWATDLFDQLAMSFVGFGVGVVVCLAVALLLWVVA